MKIKPIALALCAGLMLGVPAHAHRVGIPVTTIEWNDRSQVWEIIHRLSAHDLEDALGPGTDLGALSPQELNQTLSSYVEDWFQIAGIMSLNFVGAEIDRDIVWSYYELSGLDQTIVIRNQLLQSAEATSVSLINVETRRGRESLTFDADSGWKGLKLERPGSDA